MAKKKEKSNFQKLVKVVVWMMLIITVVSVIAMAVSAVI